MKVSQNDKIQIKRWITSLFLKNGKELRSFSKYHILIYITYSDQSRKLENWLILKFVFIRCKTLKVSEDDQIR